MLEIKNINKNYQTGEFIQKALNNVSIKFREHEFVAILGPSGSGKTTLLNILGGLDQYDHGDLLVNGLSTKKFKSKDWDAYRNNCIGFIFQSYNLISHISIQSNVELTMTLSNYTKKKRKSKAQEALKRVGLIDHAHKKPNQLSGGQMQRVAIARALVNDPNIILADEPTGALDSKTSIQIMEMIKDIAKDKLVIMVTHNRELAEKYASRIIELKDGEIVSDSNPYNTEEKNKKISIKKTKMSFLTAISLSFNNILTKKGRTILTALASSIGIIGIALILSLSNGFDIQIKKFESDSLSSLPIVISEESMTLDEENAESMMGIEKDKEKYPSDEVIYPKYPIYEQLTVKNVITKEYIDFIENLDSNKINGISYTRITNMNLITKKYDIYSPVSMQELSYSVLPKKLGDNQKSGIIEEDFDLLAGSLPETYTDLILMVDMYNNLPSSVITALGLDKNQEKLTFDDLIGKEIKLVNNDEYYINAGNYFLPSQNYEEMYNASDTKVLRIVGIIRAKEGNKIYQNSSALLYSDDLIKYVIEQNQNSQIVKAQKNADYNIMTGEKFSDDEKGTELKEQILAYLGADSVPMAIQIYPTDFESKEYIVNALDEYNSNKNEEEKILYTDMSELMTELSSSIMDGITIVLIAFSSISLVVSSIMIGIITYISVLERTKEIGILRSLGARKKDITRVFNAETTIIGLFSGLLGIGITSLLIIPVNIILYNLTELKNVAILNPLHAVILIVTSLILTLIGGFIPAIIASKKNPVEALRTE